MPPAILRRSNPNQPDERAPKSIHICKPAPGGNLLRRRSRFKQAARGVRAGLKHPIGRGNPNFPFKKAGKVAGTELHAPGKVGNTVIFGGVRRNPTLDFLQGGTSSGNSLPPAAELALATGALKIHHKLGRNVERQITAKVFFHERQGEIEPGGNTSGRAKTTVPNMNGIGLHFDRGERLREALRHRPMGRNPVVIEQPGFSQHEGTSADRTITAGARNNLSQPADQPGRRRKFRGVGSTSNQKGINFLRRSLIDGLIRQQSDARGTADMAGSSGYDPKVIDRPASLLIGLGKNIERPRHIQQLGVREDKEGNNSGSSHGCPGLPVNVCFSRITSIADI